MVRPSVGLAVAKVKIDYVVVDHVDRVPTEN
jgi:hypothetical protein